MESDWIIWGKMAFVNNGFWSKKKRMKRNQKMKKWLVEKESVVGGEVNNAHNLVVKCHVFFEGFVGLINVVKELKTFKQPADDFH